MKEIRLRPKIGHLGVGWYDRVESLLRGGCEVKLTVMLRGRERQHPELGARLLGRIAGQVINGVPRSAPQVGESRHTVSMVLEPAPPDFGVPAYVAHR